MTKPMNSRSVFDRLKNFQEADPESVRRHNKAVRETLLPELKKQLQRKEQGVAAKAKTFKVF